jgi:diguanylate cyclase (GGDEF)-like protein
VAPTGDRSRLTVVAGYGGMLAVLGAALTVAAALEGSPLHHRALSLPWWVLAALFVGAHTLVLNIQAGRETRSIVLTEIPFVLGLALAAPLVFVTARITGAVTAQAVLRRQWRQPVKLAFNLAVVVAETGVGLAVFHALASSTSHSPRTWVAAGVAATVASTVGGVGVAALITRVETGTLRLRDLVIVGWESLPQTLAVATVGVVATTALITSPWAAIPLTAVGGIAAVAYRAYARLVERHENVERLYEFTQAVSSHHDTDAIVAQMLQQVRDILHAEAAVLTFFGNDGRPESEAVLRRGSSLERRAATYLTADAGWVVDMLCRDEERVLFGRDTRDAASRHWLDTAGLREALMVPLRGEDGVAAALIVTDRLGEARGFDDSDVHLLQTAANHGSVALRHGRLVDRLRYDSLHDGLTGVPNRAYLQQEVERRLSALTRGGAPFAVAMLDLDAFKDVNDTLGHHHGDVLLCEVANRLTTAMFGRCSIVSRFGGDEFALLFTNCESDEAAAQLCRGVLEALVEPMMIDGTAVDVSASIGIARAPAHANTWVELMKRADLAMYAAKQAGREVVVYDPAQDETSPSRLALVAALRQAIADGELTIHVQPQVSLATGTVTCVEALTRWERPGHGLVPPDEFIPLAERTGLIRPLTDVVLEQAIAACAGWQTVAPEVGVAVNLSARSLRGDGLDEQVDRLLRRYHLPAHLLTLEITESTVMADPASTLGLLHRLRMLGVRLSIDDFGTGYSSLSYLRRLPVQEVKVDRSFVQRMHVESDDTAIVRSIVELARTLGLKVVAEGVEESATYDVLESLGCDLAQGYLISRPLPVSEFRSWIVDSPWSAARRPTLVAVNEA